ncbi:MAG: agmatine deiminase family protein [Sedimenticola sp.]|nr:agmatine deiminase family protein [Sedimenticola sp.]
MNTTPTLPAEWADQSAVMLTWPHPGSDWDDQLEEVEQLYLEISHHITRRQALLVVCHSESHYRRTADRMKAAKIRGERVHFAIAPSNDSWARDHGPLTVLGPGGPQLLDFQFNGWGAKYPYELDNLISPTLFKSGIFGNTTGRSVALVLEGGALETDGQGTLLATRSSILDKRRNPALNQQQVESQLASQLGFRRFLWLAHGHLSGDDTDGHIDTLVRFADPATLIHVTAQPDDPDFPELEAMVSELKAFRQADGEPYRLLALPPPPACLGDNGERLPASYANFLIINDAVLLPVYGGPGDAQAQEVLQQAFPGREIIPVNCLPLIRQHGSLHCITMQFPAQLRLHRSESVRAAG